MRERLRPVFSAFLALLIGGDLASRGYWETIDLWRFLFPYVWLFLALQAFRAKRGLRDVEAFLLGAAVGLIHDGVYAKSLQEGAFFLGIDWLGSVCAVFDWGMVTVLALHAADARFPRAEAESDPPPQAPERTGLVLLPAVAFCVYLIKTFSGRYRFDRMIGDVWPLSDILFLIVAGLLVRRVLVRAENDTHRQPDRWLWSLAAFCVWLPGAQGLGRLAEFLPWSFILLSALAWAAAVGWGTWLLWSERAPIDATPRRVSPPMLGAAGWRLVGAMMVLSIWGTGAEDPRSSFAFSLLVELPTRCVFAYAFLTSRVEV